MRIHRLDADHLATAAAAEVARRLRAAHSARGRAAVAFSGGSTPAALFDALVDEDVPWPEVHVLQTDERMAPAGSPDRNLRLITEHLTARVALPATNLHPIPVEDGPAEAVADQYAEVLDAVCGGLLDLVHLGLGADGHTAFSCPVTPPPSSTIATSSRPLPTGAGNG